MGIAIRDLCKRFADTDVLSGATFQVVDGQIVGLIGPSGGGKSTLLKILGCVIDPDSGELDRGGLDACSISLMFQEGALFDSLSVVDIVGFALTDGFVPLSGLSSERRAEVLPRVAWILQRVGLLKAAHKMPAQISGGMRRRASLARALVCNPRLALLDDPTAGLDPVASSVIMDLIVELHRESQQTTIIASHDLRRLLPICDVIVALFNGRVVFQGTREDLESAPEEVKHFVACRFDLDEQVRRRHDAGTVGAGE
jgi:ABC-type transporter Mla maintaining outer membrane lipid asymmetry ATPase subunit MlaF